ncbi:MAG: PIN domain-containing protein [Pseudonocardiaceae bacterium]
MSLVLDSRAITALGRRDRQTAARITALRRRGLWPPIVPTAVLVDSLTGNRVRDGLANRTVGLSLVHPLDEPLARRAAQLRGRARAVSAVDAIVVATAELFGAMVITGDPDGLARLSRHANGVALRPV